jgi:hypothetical protein
MANTRQRMLQFDSLEGKVLLSTGMADPAATIYQHKPPRFHMNGTLSGFPTGTSGPDGYNVTTFPVEGHVASMGNVAGSIYLTDTFVPIGKLPNLSKANLELYSQGGSIHVTLNASGTHHYRFTIMSGTGDDTWASGSGKLTISSSHNSLDFTIKLQSKGG